MNIHLTNGTLLGRGKTHPALLSRDTKVMWYANEIGLVYESVSGKTIAKEPDGGYSNEYIIPWEHIQDCNVYSKGESCGCSGRLVFVCSVWTLSWMALTNSGANNSDASIYISCFLAVMAAIYVFILQTPNTAILWVQAWDEDWGMTVTTELAVGKSLIAESKARSLIGVIWDLRGRYRHALRTSGAIQHSK